MDVYIAQPNTIEQAKALKAFMQALNIHFKVSEFDDTQNTYKPEFVAKIMESKKQVENGQVTRVEKENLKAFLGL